MKPRSWQGGPPGGWIPIAGVILLAAWIPLARYPTLSGAGVVPFLISFVTAGLAYAWALKRLEVETPRTELVWGLAVGFRLALLLTPATLSADVYRYIWDGHLVGLGLNPYAEPVNSPLLDVYATALREKVDFAWMATPYLPFAQAYFGLVEWAAPQSPLAFQVGAVLLDLATGYLVWETLPRLGIASRASLAYLWNPLVMVESAHSGHVDALMVFFLVAGVWSLGVKKIGTALSALSLGLAVLVKGWPGISAPLFLRRWGLAGVVGFGIVVSLPVLLFSWGAGWGLAGPADGRGVFGALRIYSTTWTFNPGVFFFLEKGLGAGAARLVGLIAPGLAGLWMGWRAWQWEESQDNQRRRARWMALLLGLYLLLSPTVHPWYLVAILALLPFFWPAAGECGSPRRWIWAWVYFMFFEAFTYLAYSGVSAPGWLWGVQLVGNLPFWALLVRAGLGRRAAV